MESTLRGFQEGWVRHRRMATDLVLLWLAMEGAESFSGREVPLWARLGALVAFALLPHPPSAPEPSALRRLGAWLRRFPAYALPGLCLAALSLFFFPLGRRFFLFFPLWVAATGLVHVVDWRNWAFLPLVRAWRRLTSSACMENFRRTAGRFDLVLGESVIAAGALFLGTRLFPLPEGASRLAWITGLGWILSTLATRRWTVGPVRGRCVAAALKWVLFCGIWGGWLAQGGRAIGRGPAVIAFYLGAALMAYHFAVSRQEARRGSEASRENFRWIALGFLGLALMHPFAMQGVHGTGDAVWYATMVADAVTQARSGFLPILAGQSEYQFNGAVFPVRIAPGFHHAAALLDALTFYALGFAALQNLLLIAIGVIALFSAYFCLGAVLPERRGLACLLALLYVACPGVLCLAYNTDLFMTWTTVPFLPLVVYGLVRVFSDEMDAGWFWVAIGMGGIWWGHAPEALFVSLAVIAAGACWLWFRRPTAKVLAAAGRWLALGAVLASYPIISYLIVARAVGSSAGNFSNTNAGTIAFFVRQAFLGTLLPLSERGRLLADFQLGYVLLGLLGFVAYRAIRFGSLPLRFIACAAGFYFLLLVPLPYLNLWMWELMPAVVRNASANWAMNRLYLPIAGLVVFGAALVLKSDGVHRYRGRWLKAGIVTALVWTLFQVSRFWHGSHIVPYDPVLDPQRIRPENAMVTRNAYLVFPSEPATYSDGAVDPILENRLFRRSDFQPLADNLSAAAAQAGNSPLAWKGVFGIGSEGNRLQLDHPLRLDPGKHYLLTFDFLRPGTPGLLMLTGGSFFRAYGLPTYGQAKSFGAEPGHPRSMGVWTTASEPQAVAVYFYCPAYEGRLGALLPFARVAMTTYDPAHLPVQIESWLPYRARVTAPSEAWLETPRMYQTGYAADVDGRPASVQKSPEGLAMVEVPQGDSDVSLRLHAPLPLILSFWAALAAWFALVCLGLAGLITREREGTP